MDAKEQRKGQTWFLLKIGLEVFVIQQVGGKRLVFMETQHLVSIAVKLYQMMYTLLDLRQRKHEKESQALWPFSRMRDEMSRTIQAAFDVQEYPGFL